MQFLATLGNVTPDIARESRSSRTQDLDMQPSAHLFSDLNSGLRRSGLRHDIITEAMDYLGCFRHPFSLANVTIRYPIDSRGRSYTIRYSIRPRCSSIIVLHCDESGQ